MPLRAGILVCVLVAAAALAAPAGAAPPRMLDWAYVAATGEVTVSWQGDPARGCAEAGVCDVTGVAVLAADEDGGGTTIESRRDPVAVELEAGTVRVLRGPRHDPAGVCTDATGRLAVALAVRGPAGGRLRYTPIGEASTDLKGRCAGPLGTALTGALPTASITTAAARRDRLRLVLRGTRPFVEGPYRGTVTTDIVVEVRYARERDESSDWSAEDEEDGRRSRPRRQALLELRFAVDRLAGTATTAYTGGLGCATLDACGLQGTDTLTLTGSEAAVLHVTATGPAAKLRSRSVASALAALRRGDLTVGRGSTESWPVRSAWRREVAWGGSAAVCRDARDGSASPGAGAGPDVPSETFEATPTGAAVRLAVAAPDDRDRPSTDARCPGPVWGAGSPGEPVLAASVPLARLLAGPVDVPLATSPGAAATRGFDVRQTGAVTVRLRPAEHRLRIVEERGG